MKAIYLHCVRRRDKTYALLGRYVVLKSSKSFFFKLSLIRQNQTTAGSSNTSRPEVQRCMLWFS